MKKYPKILLSLTAIALIVPTVFSHSADAVVNTANSNVNVEFTAPEDAVDVVDPEDPSQPASEEDVDQGDTTANQGPLTLDFVSHFDFGTHSITTAETTYNVLNTRPFIQVSDRRGTGAGWHVTAQLSAFTNDGAPSLEGASIEFSNGEVASTSTSPAPSTSPFTLLSGGDSQRVTTATAADGALNTAQGLGTWVTRWLGDGNESVQLTVLESTATPGTHTSTITWNLVDGPGN